jgi:hypothetical protein
MSNSKRAEPSVKPQEFKQPVNEQNVPDENPKNQEQKSVGLTDLIRNSAHPTICLLTITFKILAILAFILLDIFVSSEAIAYLVVIILGSMDFWITKNISGRILVGLRWWNEVKEDGQEVWIFESKNESN